MSTHMKKGPTCSTENEAGKRNAYPLIFDLIYRARSTALSNARFAYTLHIARRYSALA